jgi:endonuclease G, mitochondrial
MDTPETSLLEAAGLRFRQRPKAVEPAPPPTRRTQYLARNLAKARAGNAVTAAVAAGAPRDAGESVAQISQERIIGSSDLLDVNYLELAIAVSRAVARIQIGNAFGTGFLIGPGLLMTNHHVIQDVEVARRAVAQFDYQDNANHEMLPRHDYRFDANAFFVSSAELDFSVVGVSPQSDKSRPLTAYPWLRMIADIGKAEKGDPLNIIQHPRGGLKQIAFRKNEVMEIPEDKKDFLYYTTDTEPGSSGSPCFNDQWELVALHHSGVPDVDPQGRILRTDGQLWHKGADPDGLIRWVGNEGVRISAIVAALRAADLKPEWRDLRARMLESAPPNPIQLAREVAASHGLTGVTTPEPEPPPPHDTAITPDRRGGTMGTSFSWTIPIRVTISVDGAAQAPVGPVEAVAVRAAATVAPAPGDGAEEVIIDQDWTNRKGYDPSFLGVNIPLPRLSAAQEQNTVEVPPQFRKNGQKLVLNYHHYSVVMNKKRRTAWFSAGMIDGTRFKDFKRGKDKWFLDPRIGSQFQMGEELYAAKNTDRGHLTRFKDLSWGVSKDEAVAATNDSFHFTNCTLQLDGFNEGKERWQGLEQFLLEQHAKKDERKMVVITGPVLLASDPNYRNPSMNYTARIPLAFWKVCCLRRANGTLAATAFKLGQEDITELPGFEEKFDIGVAQITVADLQKLTGLDFGVLAQHDHFAESGEPGTLEIAGADGDRRRVRPITDFGDIVV